MKEIQPVANWNVLIFMLLLLFGVFVWVGPGIALVGLPRLGCALSVDRTEAAPVSPSMNREGGSVRAGTAIAVGQFGLTG